MTLEEAMERLAVAELERWEAWSALVLFGQHRKNCACLKWHPNDWQSRHEYERHWCDCGFMGALEHPFPFSNRFVSG